MGLWWVKNYMFNKPSPKSGESSTPNFINAIGAHQQLQRSAFRCGLREVCAPSCSFIKESQALHAGVTRKKPICNGYHPNMIRATFQSWGWYDVGQNLLWDIEQKKHTDIENQIFQAHDMKKMVNRGNIWWCDHDITKPWTFNTHTHMLGRCGGGDALPLDAAFGEGQHVSQRGATIVWAEKTRWRLWLYDIRWKHPWHTLW